MVEVRWRATPAQSTVLLADARFPVVRAGRRFGKTELGIAWLLGKGQRLVENRHDAASLDLWWCAPTYELAERAHDKIVRKTTPQGKRNPFADLVRHATNSPGDVRIEFRGGYTVDFKSAERERSLVGAGVHAAVYDEAAAGREKSWIQELRPALADTEGPCMFISTPKGKNWFHRLDLMGQERRASTQAFHFTSFDNPFLSRAELDDLKEGLTPRAYHQEILAEYVDDVGAFFKNVRDCIQGSLEAHVEGIDYIVGWDPAKHQDWSVVVVDRDDARHTVAFDRFQRVPYPEQVKRVGRLVRDYARKGSRVRLVIDSNGAGEPVYDYTERELANVEGVEVIAFKFTTASKQDLFNNLALLIGEKSTSWPEELNVLTNELELFEHKLGNKMGAPEGWHDDAATAKALAAWAASGAGRVDDEVRVYRESWR